MKIGRTQVLRVAGWLVPSLFFLYFTIDTTWPFAAQMSDSVFIDYGDSLINAWALRWNLHKLPGGVLDLFHAPIFYPTRYTLALSENLIGLSILFWPVDLIFDDTLILCNFVTLFSFFSLGLIAFAIFKRVTGSWWLGMIAGVAIGFAPTRFTQLGHLQLLNYQPMLLSIFLAERWLRTFRNRDAVFFFAALIAQFYFGIYLFVFNLVFISAFVPLLLFLRRTAIPWRIVLVQSLIGSACLALFILPVYLPYRVVRETMGIAVSPAQLADRGSSLTDFLRFSGLNKAHGDWSAGFRNRYSPFPGEHESAFPFSLGVMMLGGLIAGVFYLRRARSGSPPDGWDVFAASLLPTLICFFLMFGPTLHFLHQPHPRIPMLYDLYYRFFPGIQAIKAPPRFVFPLSIGITTLAVIPLGWVRRTLGPAHALKVNLALAFLFLVLVFESQTKPMIIRKAPPKDRLPGFVAALKQQPQAPVFFWPAGYDQVHEPLYMYYGTYIWYPMVNGLSGYLPPRQWELLSTLIETFPSEEAIELLRATGVRYVIVQGQWLEAVELRDLTGRLQLLTESESLGRIYSDSLDSIWEIL